MSFVYILKSIKDGRLYIGSTNDLERRLSEHRSGTTWTTKRLGDFNLVFSQEFQDATKARSIENRLKKMKRKDYLESIIKDGFIKMS